MVEGQFYFVKDEFFAAYDSERKLMQNDEVDASGKKRGRPCFYAFKDKKQPLIYWCIPISSQVDKYMRIYKHKLDKQRERGVKKPICTTIRFAEVMGVNKAFLIQNMFPITQKYVREVYINHLTKKAVRIPQNIEREIALYANEVLRLVRSGNKHLVFSDIIKTYSDLISELER